MLVVIGAKTLADSTSPVDAIHDVHIAIAIRMYQNLSGLSVDRKIEKDVFVYSVIVVKIVGAELIKPHRFARVRIAREDAGR